MSCNVKRDVEIRVIIDERGVFECHRLHGDIARHLSGADSDGINVDSIGFQRCHRFGGRFAGGFAAIREEHDAGDPLTLHILKDGGERADDLCCIAAGFEIVQRGDGIVDRFARLRGTSDRSDLPRSAAEIIDAKIVKRAKAAQERSIRTGKKIDHGIEPLRWFSIR